MPDYADYNLTVERQLLPTTVLSVAYVGSEARHLAGEIDANQPTLAAIQAHPTTKINALRPYLGYGYIKNRTTIFTSNYNSLQLDIQHRSSKGLTVGAAYTWSKTLTTNSADRDSAATYTQNLKMDYGPSTFNQPQTLVFNYVYSLPFFKEQHGAEGLLLGGWELSGITQLLSGTSFSVVQSGDPYAGSCATCSVEGLGINSIDGSNAARPDQVAKVHMTKKVDQWFSYHSFSAAQGHWGSTSAGSLLGPGMDKWDLALAKNTKLGEHVTFQLRAEAFNLFNHTNFSGVGSNISSGLPDDPDVNKRGNFGTVTGDHEPRLLQLGGKISF